MTLTEQEATIEQEALDYARAEKKGIAKRLTDPTIYLPEGWQSREARVPHRAGPHRRA